MPVPALPSNTTQRVWVQYTSLGKQHEMQLRYPPTVNLEQIEESLPNLRTLMVHLLFTSDSVLGAQYAEAGSNIRVPVAMDSAPGDYSPFSVTDQTKPLNISSVGKSPDGHKVSWHFYTPIISVLSPEFRLAISDLGPSWQNLIEGVQGAIGVTPCTISDLYPHWASYVNVSWNAYWQRAGR